MFRYNNILELENLLINCQYLDGLYIMISSDEYDDFFRVLAKSSPVGLFKFKFRYHYNVIKLESLKLFFDNWKGKHPMSLQLNSINNVEDFVEKYKTEGIVNKFKNYIFGNKFEWI